MKKTRLLLISVLFLTVSLMSITPLLFAQGRASTGKVFDSFRSRSEEAGSTLFYELESLDTKTSNIIDKCNQLLELIGVLAEHSTLSKQEIAQRLNQIKVQEISYLERLTQQKATIKELESLFREKENEVGIVKEELLRQKQKFISSLADSNEIVYKREREMETLEAELITTRATLRNLKMSLESKVGQEKDIKKIIFDYNTLKEESRLEQERIKKLTEDLASKENKIKNLAQEINTQKRDLLASLADNNNMLYDREAKMESLQKRVSSFQKEIKGLEEIIEASEKGKKELEGEVESVRKNLADQDEAYGLEIVKLKDTLAGKKEHIADLQTQLANASRQTTSFSRSLEDKTKDTENLVFTHKEEKQEFKNTISKQAATVKNLKNSLQRAEKEVKKANSDLSLARKKLNTSLTDNSFVLNKKEAKLLDLESKIDLLEKEGSDLKNQVKEKDIKLADLKKSLSRGQESLQEDARKQKETITTLKKTISDRDRQIEDTAKEISSISAMVSELKKELASKSKIEESLQGKVSELKTDLSKDAESQKKRIEQLTFDLKAKEKVIAVGQNKIDLLEKDLKKSTLVLKASGQEKTKSSQLQSELTKVRLQAAQKDEIISKMKQEFDMQLSQYKEKLDLLQIRISSKEKEVENLSNQKTKLAREKSTIEVKASEKISQLERARQRLQVAFQDEIEAFKMELSLAKEKLVVTVLSDVLFNSGSDSIRVSSLPILSKISQALSQEVTENNIIIEGHTDNVPIVHSHWRSNWELSSARALSVLDYFIDDCQLDPVRLSIGGYGEFKPISDNESERGRQKNRRVEIIILPKEIVKKRVTQ